METNLAEGESHGSVMRIDRAGDGTVRFTIDGQGVLPREDGVQALIDKVLASPDGSAERQSAFDALYVASVQYG